MAIYRTYVVRSGDTLGRIATAHGTSVQALITLNGLTNANRIARGRTLKVGVVSATYYQVMAGDTLGSVAARFGATVGAIRAANGIRNADRITVGQRLVIPPATTSIAQSPAPVPPELSPGGSRIPGRQLGDLSRKYEVAKGGPGTVSSGKGDRGGVSYGTYQMASKMGRPAEFLSQEGAPWAAEFAGLVQGTPAFSTCWKSVAAREPDAFQAAQHGYIARTHYGVQLAFVKARTGQNLASCSAAMHDVLWSCAVQHGPSSTIVVKALETLAKKVGDAGFDKDLIQAVYAERGRRREDGVLAYFSGSSKAVQDGIAARFRCELKDALDLLAAEAVKERIGPIVEAGDMAADSLVKKAAKSLTDDEVRLLLERYADDEAVADFIGGAKVAVALRKSTNNRTYRKGIYDDAILVVWRQPGGAVRIRRFPGNTEPAGEYAFDGPQANKGSFIDLDRDGLNDLGRLMPGTYHYVRQSTNFNGASFFKARNIQVVMRDTNQDGDFGAGDMIDPAGAQRTMYIHQGGNSATWSAGCQTIPEANYGDFLKLVGGQAALSYVLINTD
ncbi:MAG: LysM peptidoglycan-binding domain-containing protein [Sphingobium sp.]